MYIYLSLSFVIWLIMIAFLFDKCISRKFFPFKKYNLSFSKIVLICCYIVIAVAYSLDKQLLFISIIGASLFIIYLLLYIGATLSMNKKALDIIKFKEIDFKKMIEKVEVKVNKSKMTNILKYRHKKTMSSLKDRYETLNLTLDTYSHEQYKSILIEFIMFNESFSIPFNYGYNLIQYKLSLYLFMDLQTKEISA